MGSFLCLGRMSMIVKKSLIVLVILVQSLYLNAHDLEASKNACKKGDAKACYTLGNIYEYGKNVKQSEKNAKKYYKKACEGKNVDACNRLDKIEEDSVVGGC